MKRFFASIKKRDIIIFSSTLTVSIAAGGTLLYFKKQPPKPTPLLQNPLATHLASGKKLYADGNVSEALKNYAQALKKTPESIEALKNLGVALAARNDYAQALPFFQTAAILTPKNPTSLIQTGMCLHRLKKDAEACPYFEKALKLAPNSFDAHMQYSKSLAGCKKLDQALTHAQKAVALHPQNNLGRMNLGFIYNEQGNLDAAMAQYTEVLKQDPTFASALYNMGYSLKLTGQMREAIPYLKKALRYRKDHVDTHIALSHAYWSLGDFNNAWKEYDLRWQRFARDPRPMSVPLWNGTADVKNKKFLLYAEQGMGDTLQFIRFAKLLKERGAHITCKIQNPLKDLLAPYPHVDTFITTWPTQKELKQFDYQAPLMSMPGLLNITPETIPTEMPYLQADTKLVNHWRKKINPKAFNIGLCWHVDPIHEVEKSPLSRRSIPATLFAALNTIKTNKPLRFYSLQKVNGTEMLKDLPNDFSFELETFDPHFDQAHGRFMDTAALMQNLDLVITVDTSICHLAAGLGKETWVLLPYAPDCRFSTNRTDIPWYPTMRLFRQKKPFEWQPVIADIQKALKKKVASQ